MSNPFTTFADRKLFGVPIAQSWADLALWEEVLNALSAHQLFLIELGTHGGGMTGYLDAQAKARGLCLRTFDIDSRHVPSHLWHRFVQLDIFTDWPRVYRRFSRGSRGFLVFCDNGDKPRELAMVAETVASGDYVAAHDYGTEWQDSDVPDCLEPFMQERAEQLGSVTRFFRKKG